MTTERATARRALLGALVCQMGLGLGGYVFATFLRPIVVELGWSRTAFSVSSLPFLSAMALASPVVGALVDRVGPRWVFAGGITVVAAALVGLSGMQTLAQFYVLVFVLGAGVTALGDIPAGTVATRFVGAHAGLALGFVYVGSNVGGALVPIVATHVTDAANWRAALGVLAAIGVVVVLPAALWLVPGGTGDAGGSNAAADDDGATLAEARRTPAFAVLAGCLFLFYCYYLGVNNHLMAYLADEGFSAEAAALRFGYVVAIGIAGKLGMGLVVESVGLRAAALATFGSLAVASLLLFGLVAVPGQVPVFLTIHGLAVAAENVVLPLLVTACFGSRHMPAIYGALMVALLPGGVIGPLAAAWCFDVLGTYRPAFAAFAAGNVVVVGALGWLLRRAGAARAGWGRRGSGS